MAKIFHGQLSLYTEGGWGKKLVESGKIVKKGRFSPTTQRPIVWSTPARYLGSAGREREND
jgi:hypothetical protein